MHPNDKKHPVSEALRAAGYIPLPRLWVKSDDMTAIHAIAGKHSHEVNAIRGDVHTKAALGAPDPKADRNAAWDAYQSRRN